MKKKKDINRYTMNLISDSKYIPLADSSLENFERLSTNFNNLDDLISLIYEIFNIDFKIDDIVITYQSYEKTRRLKLLHKDYRSLVTDRKLVDKITLYLSNINNVRKLNLKEINNSFLYDKINKLLSHTSMHEYNNDLNHFHNHLINNYKLKRDFSLFLDKHLKMFEKNLLEEPINERINPKEIYECFKLMKIHKPFSYYFSREGDEFELEPFQVENDDFLNTLIERGDIDTISKNYDVDDLYSLGVTGILDGANILDETKGKSK